MRVSQHSGREGSAKHNDRSFLQQQDDGNRYWCLYNSRDFEMAERYYYRTTYADALQATNDRYRQQRHPERCKTLEQLYHGRHTKPEEIILQIGDISDAETVKGIFLECLVDYLKRLEKWNEKHGKPMQILNIAVHFDESSPHAHMRRVWEYTDKNGYKRLGQNAALKAAGIDLPNPGEKEGRYNNRKMVFDAFSRSLWQDVCRSHGLSIETEPRQGLRHKSVRDYKRSKEQNQREAWKQWEDRSR